MKKLLRRLLLGALVAVGVADAPGCEPTPGQKIDLHGQQVRMTFIHTSDIHSRLFPYEYTPLTPDVAAGLATGKGPYGGVARMAYIVKRERANADRVLHIDGGDVSQGAPIYNYFKGEAEFRALAQFGVDAMVIANHEFDNGSVNVFNDIQKYATFPVLAANYKFDDVTFPGVPPIGNVISPYTIFNVRGLRVGLIGMGNLSTLTSIFELPNKLGFVPYQTEEIAQYYIDVLRPQVDLVVLVTHLGLDVDEPMIEGTEGADIVLGGHNHIVVSPPKVVFDCGGVDAPTGSVMVRGGSDGSVQTQRACKPRRVLLMHSGAFAKFVGRLDVTVTDDPTTIEQANSKPAGWYDPVNGFEVIAHTQKIIPIDNSVPEDRAMGALMEPYQQALTNLGTLDELVGYAPADIKRTAPAGADSQLGNLVSTSMWLRLGVQTDWSLTNTTGIRADLPKGPITVEQMFNVFPFDNSITTMILSSSEIIEMLDFVARRSQSRACVSQVQIAGAQTIMNCGGCDVRYRPDVLDPTQPCVEQVFIGYQEKVCTLDSDCSSDPVASRYSCDRNVNRCRLAMVKGATYTFATNNYLAGGGSGFRVLQRNTTQQDTGIQQRDAVMDFVRQGHPCGWQNDPNNSTGGGLLTCSVDADCAGLGAYVCACPQNVGLDRDGDGLADQDDACPDLYADITKYPNGCPPGATPGPLGDPNGAQMVAGSTLACVSRAQCAGGSGRCVLTSCRQDVASREDIDYCNGAVAQGLLTCRQRACMHGGEQCKVLACLDASVGALVDARITMLGR